MRASLLKRTVLLGVMFVAGSSFALAQTFCANPALAIPDNSPAGASFTIDVTDSGIISDLDVSLDITHTWQGDVSLSLSNPAATTTVDLIARPGDSQSGGFGFSADNFASGFTLDDEASEAYDIAPPDGVGNTADPGIPDVTGAWLPFGLGGISSLSDFDGQEGNGLWTVFVSDNAGGDLGTVNEVCLIFDPPLPVEMTSFTSQVNGTNVSLNWETASETNNAGFEVQVRSGSDWTALGFVDGHGTTTEAQTYSFNAGEMGIGTHAFRLKQIDFDGAFEYSTEVEATIETPGTHVLSSAYPNPFNPQSQFTLTVAQEQNVTAELFNTLGQRVAVLFSGTVEANQPQLVTIDGAGLASGMYVVRVNGTSFRDALNVTLLK